MIVQTVYTIYKNDTWSDRKKQKFDISDDTIQGLENLKTGEQLLENSLKDTISKKLNLKEDNIKILEVYQ